MSARIVRLSSGLFAHSQNRSKSSIKVLPWASEEGMAHLALTRFGSVLDFGKQFRLNPDALVRDPLGIGLGFSDQWRQALAQLGG